MTDPLDAIIPVGLIAVPILVVVLARTRLWWLVPATICAAGVALIAKASTEGDGHDIGGMQALGAGAELLVGMVLALFGVVAFVLCARARGNARRRAAADQIVQIFERAAPVDRRALFERLEGRPWTGAFDRDQNGVVHDLDALQLVRLKKLLDEPANSEA
jgi:hypothetical protein